MGRGLSGLRDDRRSRNGDAVEANEHCLEPRGPALRGFFFFQCSAVVAFLADFNRVFCPPDEITVDAVLGAFLTPVRTIRFRAGQGLYSRRYACSAFHRAVPAVTCRPSAVRHQLDL